MPTAISRSDRFLVYDYILLISDVALQRLPQVSDVSDCNDELCGALCRWFFLPQLMITLTIMETKK